MYIVRHTLCCDITLEHQREEMWADAEPKLSELMNKVAAAIPAKWRDVGIQLNLSLPDLDAIGLSGGDPLQHFSSVFHLWSSKASAAYRWSTVIEALEAPAVNEHRLARILKTKLMSTTSGHS